MSLVERGKPYGCQISNPHRSSERLRRPALWKASGFPANAGPSSSSAQAGRLSLPACAEEVLQEARPSERQSLSAYQAAEPLVIIDTIERNLDKPGQALPLQHVGGRLAVP